MTDKQPEQPEQPEQPAPVLLPMVTPHSLASAEELRVGIMQSIANLTNSARQSSDIQAEIEAGYSEALQDKLQAVADLKDQLKELEKEAKRMQAEETPLDKKQLMAEADATASATRIELGLFLSEFYYRNPDINAGATHVFGEAIDKTDSTVWGLGINWTRSNGWHVAPEHAPAFLGGLTPEELALFEIQVKFKPAVEEISQSDFNTYAMVNKRLGRLQGLQLKPRVLSARPDQPMLFVQPVGEDGILKNADMPALEADCILPSPLSSI